MGYFHLKYANVTNTNGKWADCIQLLEYAIPPAAAAPAAAVSQKSPRLTHYPTANTLSNGLHTIQWLTHYPITDAWVTRLEREGRSQEAQRASS